MITELLTKDYDAIIQQFAIVFLCDIIVIISIGIDLYFGVKKSKQNGIFTHSYGYRQTSKKLVEYLAFMFFMLFIDILNPFWAYFEFVPLPLFSICGAIVLVFTEFKSVREKSSEKFRYAIKNNPTELIDLILKNREKVDQILKGLDQSKEEVSNNEKE